MRMRWAVVFGTVVALAGGGGVLAESPVSLKAPSRGGLLSPAAPSATPPAVVSPPPAPAATPPVAAPPAFDFSLTNGGTLTLAQTNKGVTMITATQLSGTTQVVSLSATGFPSGVTSSFSQGSCAPTCFSTLSIATASSTPTGSYPITVTAGSGSVSHSTSFTLVVTAAPVTTPPAPPAPVSALPAPVSPAPTPVVVTPPATLPAPVTPPAPVAPAAAPPAPVTVTPPAPVTTPPAPPALVSAPPAPVSPAPTPVVVTPPPSVPASVPVVTAPPVTVVTPPAPVVAPPASPSPPISSYALVANTSSIVAGANITATWTAPGGSSSRDWVGLFQVGASNTAFDNARWVYTNGKASGTFTTSAPTTPGTYEFRYVLDNGYTDVAQSTRITVTTPPAQSSTPQPSSPTSANPPAAKPSISFSLSVSPSSVSPGGNVTATWTTSSRSAPLDWVGLYKVGDGNRNFILNKLTYTNGTSGSYTTAAPTTPGTYEFRYLLDDGYTDVARSSPVTVVVPPAPQPPVTPAPTPTPSPSPSPVASAPAPSNSASGPGVIQIVRLGECTGTGSNGGFACAPYASSWVDSRQPTTTNPATFSNMSNGSHTVSVTFIHGLPSISAGTCTGSGCSVSSFNLPLACDDTKCSLNVMVNDNSTQIAIKYASDYQGIGASITGGKDKPVYRVTSLDDSGSGSLRDGCLSAKSTGGVYIVFDVGGTLHQSVAEGGNLSGAIMCPWPNVTVDGFTAPGGITLPNSLMIKDATVDDYLHPGWHPHTDAHNIIFRNIRIQKPFPSGFQTSLTCFSGQSGESDYSNGIVLWGPGRGPTVQPHHIVWSHMTVSNTDAPGASSTTQVTTTGCRDMLIEWLFMRDPGGEATNFINGSAGTSGYAGRQGLYHNFFAPHSWRNPAIVYYSLGGHSNQDVVTADVRLNLIYVGHYVNQADDNASCSMGAKCNFVKNYTLGSPYAQGPQDHWWAAFCSEFGPPIDPIGTKTCGGAFSSSGGGFISNQDDAAAGFYLSGNVLKSAYPNINAPLTVDRNNSSYKAGNPPAPFPVDPISEEATAEEAACNVLKYAGTSPRTGEDMIWVNSASAELAKFYSCGTASGR